MADLTGNGSGEPFTHGFAITPSDSTDLSVMPRAIYVGGAGAVAIHDINGTALIFTAMPLGIHHIRPRRVLATGTAATGLIGLY